MFTQIDHIAIATKDIDAALETMKKLGPVQLGAVEDLSETQGVKAIMLMSGGVPIELIQPTSEDSTVARFIEKRGEGLHHIAYRVADIDAALKHCEEQGLELIDKTPRHGYAGSKVAFLHPRATLKMLSEIVERPAGHDEAPYETA